MREFGQELTIEEVALAQTTARLPFNEPTDLVPVPTPEEMTMWLPDPSPEKRRWRKEVNVSTGKVRFIELTLDEYKTRHVAKAISRNKYVEQKRIEAHKARRTALLEKLLDEAEVKYGTTNH